MTTRTQAIETGTEFEMIIGLEVHAQLATRSKMFCRCPAAYADAEGNTYVCPVCEGLPGVLPVINETAVEWTIKTALALHMEIPELSKFDRKNYHYPDLMKGYQISQYDMPLSSNGYLDIRIDGETQRLGITRVHLEEDTARLLHRTDPTGTPGYSLLDLNRSGVPLMEIVSEPDMRRAEEARTYLMTLRQILRYLKVSTADMEKGSFRCDANISLRPYGTTKFGTKVEVKNMNSFRAVYKALQYEAARQTKALREGEPIVQETRGWSEDEEVTVSQRSKEHAHDYRYFPEPDLPPLRIGRDRVAAIAATIPELPMEKHDRFLTQYGLGDYEAALLVDEQERAEYFEAAVAATTTADDKAADARAIANWIVGEMTRLMHENGHKLADVKITAEHLARLVGLIDDGTISSKMAKGVFEQMYAKGSDPKQIVAESGQTQISDVSALQSVIEKVLAQQPQAVEDYRAGKQEALKFLMGQVMKATRGQANPTETTRLLQETLGAISGGAPP